MKILITGGAGFIGSALIRYLISNTNHTVINIDKLTYAGNLDALKEINGNPHYFFEQADICSEEHLQSIFNHYQPDAVMHLAAETHVDNSIENPAIFIKTNITGTATLLEVARFYWQSMPSTKQGLFRFHHISTDEVFGDLADTKGLFTETTPYAPSSPYSASKASADHLVRAWHRTYGMPILITNCSNNYGPYQFPEKLIPATILRALNGLPLMVYGTGLQIRDWLYVDDHVEALYCVLKNGSLGETYNIGGCNEQCNIDVIRTICDLLEEIIPHKLANIQRYHQLIQHINDRPGHDKRYAIDISKIQQELGWSPKQTFISGLKKTIQWYLSNHTTDLKNALPL